MTRGDGVAVPYIGTFIHISKYDSGRINDLLDQTHPITEMKPGRALFARIRAREGPDLPFTDRWCNRDIIGLSVKGAGFGPVAVATVRFQEMRLLP